MTQQAQEPACTPGEDEMKWLGKIWDAEVLGRLPLQSKAVIYKRLQERGLVQFGSEMVHRNVEVSGWYLTHQGRYEYCKACGENHDD